jgi:hypothetical protein
VQRVVAGAFHTAALAADGTVRTWGRSAYGEAPSGTDLSPARGLWAGRYFTVVERFVPLPSDLDGDGQVGGADLGRLLGQWGSTGSGLGGDLNRDGVVNGADLGIMLGDWTASGM